MKVYVEFVQPPEPSKKEIAQLKRQARAFVAQNPNLPVRKNTPVILEDNASNPRWEGRRWEGTGGKTPYIVVGRYCQLVSVLVR
jgi:hypothetical protein